MAYRNRPFKRSFSRGGSSRFRSRLHTPVRTQRWSRGQFALQPELSVDSPLDAGLTVIPLAQITNHLFGGSNTAAQFGGNQIVRNLEIGGIVFDVQFIFKPESDIANSNNYDAYAQCIIYSDRLDNVGNPTALSTNWMTNTLPVTLSSAAVAEDADDEFPTRVHYRRAVAFNQAVFQRVVTSGDSSWPTNPVAVRTQWSKSLRLRLRLNDEQALCVAFSLTAGDSYPTLAPEALIARMMFVGSIYYRVRI